MVSERGYGGFLGFFFWCEGMFDDHLLQLTSGRAGWGGDLDFWGYRTRMFGVGMLVGIGWDGDGDGDGMG